MSQTDIDEVNVLMDEFKFAKVLNWLNNINPEAILPLDDSFEMHVSLSLTVQDLELLTHFSEFNEAITEADIFQQEVKNEDIASVTVANKRSKIGRGRGQKIISDENFVSRQLQEQIGRGRCQNQHEGDCRWLSNKTILSLPRSTGLDYYDTVVCEKKEEKVDVQNFHISKKVVESDVKETDASSGSYITCYSL